jgi:predicted enzyme involved in methoxymalonyl-ACP biosynthesis
MENFVLNTIANYGKAHGFKTLKGEYIPTAKNEMVKDHYKNLDFESNGDSWILDLDKFSARKSFIQTKE